MQDKPSLAPWLGPAQQLTYGSMPAGAVDKVFNQLHTAHKSLARLVGCRRRSPAELGSLEKDPPEIGEELQAAILEYEALALCTRPARPCTVAASEAALRLAEVLRDALPGFCPKTQGQLQEELKRPRTALEEDICHLSTLPAANRKCAIKDLLRQDDQDRV